MTIYCKVVLGYVRCVVYEGSCVSVNLNELHLFSNIIIPDVYKIKIIGYY